MHSSNRWSYDLSLTWRNTGSRQLKEPNTEIVWKKHIVIVENWLGSMRRSVHGGGGDVSRLVSSRTGACSM